MSAEFDLKEFIGDQLFFDPSGDLVVKYECMHHGKVISVTGNVAVIKLEGSPRNLKFEIGVKASRNKLKRTYVYQNETGGFYVYRNEKELHRNDHRDGKTPFQASLDISEVSLFDHIMKQRSFKTKKQLLITLLEEEKERLAQAKVIEKTSK